MRDAAAFLGCLAALVWAILGIGYAAKEDHERDVRRCSIVAREFALAMEAHDAQRADHWAAVAIKVSCSRYLIRE